MDNICGFRSGCLRRPTAPSPQPVSRLAVFGTHRSHQPSGLQRDADNHIHPHLQEEIGCQHDKGQSAVAETGSNLRSRLECGYHLVTSAPKGDSNTDHSTPTDLIISIR
jgi:hypothetical protein